MTELYEKSLRKLELDNVLAQLADCANSEDGKDRCRALLPLDDAEEICLLQQQTTAACGMIVRKGAPGFHELKPVAASLERADRGGCLTPVELLRIAGVLRCIRNVKAYYSEDGEPTVLDVYFQELSPNRYLEEKITNSILSEEEIADAASSELGGYPPPYAHPEREGQGFAAEDHLLAELFQVSARPDHHAARRPLCRAGQERIQE